MSGVDRGRVVRWVGAAAVVGSLLFLVSLSLQAFVPQPDSYQFDPSLTSRQFLRDTVAPTLTVTALTTHLAALAGIRLRDRADEWGWPTLVGWGATVAGVALAIAGYGGLFTFGQGTGAGSAIAGAGFALLAVLAVGVLGLGTGIWGIVLLRSGERRMDRLAGGLLLSVPVVALVGTILGFGSFTPAPYAIAFAVLGYDLWSSPERGPPERP